MKKTIVLLLVLIFLIFSNGKSLAVYDPLSVTNNKFGIHILFPEELSEASVLLNSNGGDWGYVTIPIKVSDRHLAKWQKFMDETRKYHIIPVLRLATEGDYFQKDSWSKPSEYDVLDFVNFLDSLNWSTKNRYLVIFNEVNRGDEWGGEPDPADYARILNYAVDTFKQRSQDYFIISSGLDNASANVESKSMDELSYLRLMNQEIPGIFSKIDGLASHSYPNPAFSAPPSRNQIGVSSFMYQQYLMNSLTGKSLPVFITETGWTSDKVNMDLQSAYYRETFADYWNDKNIVAVTPFIFKAEQGAFSQFAFFKNNEETTIYKTYKSFPKQKGTPKLSPEIKSDHPSLVNPINEVFKNETANSIINRVDKSSRTFFKWLLKI